MNAKNDPEIVNTGIPLPVIGAVKSVGGYNVEVTWVAGERTGRTEVIDIAPMVLSYKAYRPLREAPELLNTVAVINDGDAIAWGDGSILMSAEAVESLSSQEMTPAEFVAFMARNKLTEEGVASLLGYKRRQIGYFKTTGPIPRVVALACHGYETRMLRLMSKVETNYQLAANDSYAPVAQPNYKYEIA
jgi:hypothetical protein